MILGLISRTSRLGIVNIKVAMGIGDSGTVHELSMCVSKEEQWSTMVLKIFVKVYNGKFWKMFNFGIKRPILR
jgi:hypothetical protein